MPELSYCAPVIPPPRPVQPYIPPHAYIPPPIPGGNGTYVQQRYYDPNTNTLIITIPPPSYQQQIPMQQIPVQQYNSNSINQRPYVNNNSEQQEQAKDCFAACCEIICTIFCCLCLLGLGMGVSAQMH